MSDKPACCFRTWLGLQCAVRIIQAREDWFGQRQQIPTLSDARVHVSLDREGRCGRLTDRAFAAARNSNDNERNASLESRRRQLQALVRRPVSNVDFSKGSGTPNHPSAPRSAI